MTFPYRYAALGLLLAAGGCENTIFQSSPQALVIKGDPKACTHPATRALVEQVIRGASDRVVSPDEFVSVPITFGTTLMASAEPGVNVTCHTDMVIGENSSTSLIYIVVPSADNDQDIGIQWSNEMENYPYALAKYRNAQSDWQRGLNEQRAALDSSRRAILESENEIPNTGPVGPQPPSPSRPAARTTEAPRKPSLSDVPDPPKADAPAPRVAPTEQPTARNPSWSRQPSVEYPEAATGLGITGSVVLDCAASATGQLSSCNVISETPRGYGFGAAAVAGARRARVRPREQDGEATESRVRFSLRFSEQ